VRILAATLLAACATVPLAGAASAPALRFASFNLTIDRGHHTVRIATIVADDGRQVLARRSRPVVQSGGGRGSGGIANRTARTTASIDRGWRYPARLTGRECRFRATVQRGAASARSATLPFGL